MSKPPYGTDFVESECLLAALEGDWDYVNDQLAALSNNELAEFREILSELEERVMWRQTVVREIDKVLEK